YPDGAFASLPLGRSATHLALAGTGRWQAAAAPGRGGTILLDGRDPGLSSPADMPGGIVTIAPSPSVTQPYPARPARKGALLARLLSTTDHKMIGQLYLVTSFVFFFVGGALALLMRAELARPGLQFLSSEQYNQLFTMHGTIMLLLFATPMVFA